MSDALTTLLDSLAPHLIDDHAESGERQVWGARVSECFLGEGLVPEHDHPHDALAYVLGGSLEEEHEGRWHAIAAGSVVRQFRARSHRVRVGADGAHVFRVRFRLEADLPGDASLRAPPRLLAVMQTAYRLFLDADQDLRLAAWVVDLERALRRPGADFRRIAAPRWLDEAERRVMACDDPATLHDAAADLGLRWETLNDAFHRRHGCNPAEWLRRRRVFAACQRLRAEPSRPIGRIAADFGFADQAHFCRSFRRHLGRSPRDYRGMS